MGSDQNVQEIQKRFNQGTISKPFSVPDNASLTSSLKEATQRGTPPSSPGYAAPNIPLMGGFGYLGGYARPYYGGYYGEERQKLQMVQQDTRASLEGVLTPEQMNKLD